MYRLVAEVFDAYAMLWMFSRMILSSSNCKYAATPISAMNTATSLGDSTIAMSTTLPGVYGFGPVWPSQNHRQFSNREISWVTCAAGIFSWAGKLQPRRNEKPSQDIKCRFITALYCTGRRGGRGGLMGLRGGDGGGVPDGLYTTWLAAIPKKLFGELNVPKYGSRLPVVVPWWKLVVTPLSPNGSLRMCSSA